MYAWQGGRVSFYFLEVDQHFLLKNRVRIKVVILNLPGNADRGELHYLQLLTVISYESLHCSPKERNQTGLKDFLVL